MPFAVAFIGKHVCLLLENLTLELLRHICSTNKASQAAIRGNLLRWTRHLGQLGACIGSVQSGSRAVKQAQLIGSTHSFVHACIHSFISSRIHSLSPSFRGCTHSGGWRVGYKAPRKRLHQPWGQVSEAREGAAARTV